MPAYVRADFVMHGARGAIADGLFHIEEQVKAIELAVAQNPGLAFDLAKTLVESACRTILTERKHEFANADDLPKLFKMVTKCLPSLPEAANFEGDAQKSLKMTLSGLHTALKGICELRNAFGFVSHGAAGPRPAMETVQALLAAQTADAIVGYLHRIHYQDLNRAITPTLRYEDNGAFNEFVDGEHDQIIIFELPYQASEVLFQVDLDAYRNALAVYQPLPPVANPGGSMPPDEGKP